MHGSIKVVLFVTLTIACLVDSKEVGFTADVTTCLNSKNCWLKYDFTYDDSWNACHREQYVTRTTYSVGRYVGVVLCSPTRYKLFMSNSLDQTFLNIGDVSGHGQDHCELLGGSEDHANIPSDFWRSPAVTGYYRSGYGEEFKYGRIGRTGKYFGTWYECGVTIPGNFDIVVGPSRSIPETTQVLHTSAATTTGTKTVSTTTTVQDTVPFTAQVLHTSGATNLSTSETKSVTTTTTVKGPSGISSAQCLQSDTCWFRFHFTYDSSWTSCKFGHQYVRKTPYPVGKYIGVVLCSSERYSLFLADRVDDVFLNIGDGQGLGKDHCQFVGGMAINVDYDVYSPETIDKTALGYYRDHSGQTPHRGKIGLLYGRLHPKWYECGVDIPGNSAVFDGPPPEVPTTTTMSPKTTRAVTGITCHALSLANGNFMDSECNRAVKSPRICPFHCHNGYEPETTWKNYARCRHGRWQTPTPRCVKSYDSTTAKAPIGITAGIIGSVVLIVICCTCQRRRKTAGSQGQVIRNADHQAITEAGGNSGASQRMEPNAPPQPTSYVTWTSALSTSRYQPPEMPPSYNDIVLSDNPPKYEDVIKSDRINLHI